MASIRCIDLCICLLHLPLHPPPPTHTHTVPPSKCFYLPWIKTVYFTAKGPGNAVIKAKISSNPEMISLNIFYCHKNTSNWVAPQVLTTLVMVLPSSWNDDYRYQILSVFLKIGRPKIITIMLIIWNFSWFNNGVMSPKDADDMANCTDLDQTAPLGAVWSWSALFAHIF